MKVQAVTSNYKPGFGTAMNFVPRSKDGKDAGVGNTNFNYMQEFFFINLTNVDFLEHCDGSCDLKDILMNREFHDALNVEPLVKWGPSKFYLLNDFAKIPCYTVLAQQAGINSMNH